MRNLQHIASPEHALICHSSLRRIKIAWTIWFHVEYHLLNHLILAFLGKINAPPSMGLLINANPLWQKGTPSHVGPSRKLTLTAFPGSALITRHQRQSLNAFSSWLGANWGLTEDALIAISPAQTKWETATPVLSERLVITWITAKLDSKLSKSVGLRHA